MFEKKVKLKDLKSPSYLKVILGSLLDIHNHRFYRRTFILCLIIHIFITLLPTLETTIKIPIRLQPLLFFLYEIWPLPTFKMSSQDTLLPNNLFFKAFEILALLLYTVDLLPKIFVWKKNSLWKFINIFIVTMMVLQIPLALKGYIEAGANINTLKFRTLSIGLSFLLMLESMSIREQRHIKVTKSNFGLIFSPLF